MLRMISAGPCQNGHELHGWSYNSLLQASKVVCPICEIVVKDREGSSGLYCLKYKDTIDYVTPIPGKIMLALRERRPKELFQWFCPSLTDEEAKIIGNEAMNRNIRIATGSMKNIIEEMIPQLRNKSVMTEIGSEVIERLREAVFKIEKELGISPKGSYSTVRQRLDAMLNPDGTIKPEALASIPIANKASGKLPVPNKIKYGLDTWNDPPAPIAKPNGMACSKCQTFNEYAESNQSDGSYVCYSCRKGI